MTNDWSVWQRAIELAACGRYLAAWKALDRLSAQCPRGGRTSQQPGPRGHSAPPSLASLVHSARGSHLRQVGAIDRAMVEDQAAVELAIDPVSFVDAFLGLAADAIASGDPQLAARHLVQAEAHLASAFASDDLEGAGGSGSRNEGRESGGGLWRVATRAAWVRCEFALLVGEPTEAIEQARLAMSWCAGRSARHTAKSQAIMGAASISAGQPEAAARWVAEAGESARRHGWASLSWPIALIATQVTTATATSLTPALVRTGVQATRTIEAHLPEDLARQWRARSDVARLRALVDG